MNWYPICMSINTSKKLRVLKHVRPGSFNPHHCPRTISLAGKQPGENTICSCLLNPNSKKFLVRGVSYQVPGTQDPISDDRLPQLEQDVLLFKELGLNTIYICMLI
jgi:hypothetical protein